MRRLHVLTLAIGLLLPALASAPAHAQATRTWVSGVGDDANPCSRTAPCKTFAGAISKTALQGEINCLDPAGYGALTITKAITINCSETIGSVLVAGTNGIVIQAGISDRVVLRNIQFQGIGPSANAGIAGIKIISAGSVSIENCVVTQFGQQGILDQRTNAGGKLLIKDTIITHNTGSGISIAGAATNNATLDNVRSYNNAFGLAVGNGNNVTVKRSDFSSNSIGVTADPGAQISINSSAVNSNATGLNGGGIRVSDSDINFNSTAAFAGTPTSFGTNRLVGNAATGAFNTAAQQ
ncbi:right-handed parallel beta-helix repeat-containing protein [Bradyrhizobium tropiciagri]|uniref:right-handed parallel beta-helix repeat-containing protein n=1 Tax=Bradyrhizobium tropiciagri TaxID=312253 RepID=UPI001BAD4A7B|nr:right-handed parallel beta-helix repeat-containing protein [Bradyrhizobium tropiciagri]MBR0872448.1 right-handed parallel beta-helix repeat-containing protein [Bradyrhizobium tropiciagri]